ncbi:hypothetical protein EK904_009575 [Melospiza melodia maxima]|nr:hypothetical protein EK904_009575 [Melospiza melodia maxima]
MEHTQNQSFGEGLLQGMCLERWTPCASARSLMVPEMGTTMASVSWGGGAAQQQGQRLTERGDSGKNLRADGCL